MQKTMRLVMILSILSILLAGCGSPATATQPVVAATTAPSATETAAPTATPVPPTATATATALPSPTPTLSLPVALGTPYPASANKITVQNASQIVELARYGKERGWFRDARLMPDGKSILVSTSLGVYWFDAETLAQTASLPAKDYVFETVSAPDAQTLAVILAPDQRVELWKASDGSLIRALDTQGAISIAFSPDGSLLATGLQNEIKVWKTADGSLAQTFSAQKEKVYTLLFSPDGQVLYAGAHNSQVVSYNLATKKVMRAYTTYTPDQANGLWLTSLSADGSRLATLGGRNKNNVIAVWQTSDGKKTWEKSYPFDSSSGVASFAMSPDGKFAAIAYADNTVKMWEIGSTNEPVTLEKKLAPIGQSYGFLIFSSDGKKLILAENNVMGIWDVASGSLLKSRELGTGAIYSSSIAPDGKSVAGLEDTFQMGAHIWNLVDGSSSYTQPDVSGLSSVAYSPDGKFFVTGSGDTTPKSKSVISFWPLSGGTPHHFSAELNALPLYPKTMVMSADGKFIAIRSYYGNGVYIYLASDGTQFKRYNASQSQGSDYFSLGFSPDGQYLLAGEGTLDLVTTKDWKTVKQLPATFGTLSPDGTLLAYGLEDGSIQVSSFPDMKPVLTIPAQPANAFRLTFSPDGSILVSAALDHSLYFWNAKDGSLLYKIAAHTTQITNMAFLPDASALVTVSDDSTIRLWGLKP